MGTLISFRLFGENHQIEADEHVDDPEAVVRHLIASIRTVESRHRDIGRFKTLLIAALNIARDHAELVRTHEALISRINARQHPHVERLQTTDASAATETAADPPGTAGRPEAAASSVPPPDLHRKTSFRHQPPPFRRFTAVPGGQPQAAYRLPPLDFLSPPTGQQAQVDPERLERQRVRLEEKLADFGVKGGVVNIAPGPVITTFEYKPAPGVKISKIVNLTDDLALALKAMSIRIVAPIPGKDVVGIEIPNPTRETVNFRELIQSVPFVSSRSRLAIGLGKDIIGNPVVAELDRMPHLLIAGATGTGKSVGLNALITSLLYKSTPAHVRLLMIDPKRIELSFYNDIPHLLTPVVTDMKKATNALNWAVREMERRYDLLAVHRVRNIRQFNARVRRNEISEDTLPYIVIIIDELADLMMVASRDVESHLTRLAQMARAAGMHLVFATQRPSVDVLTGIIKANFPTRISFQVSSKIDSRTIIDTNGAENLLGNGDMLFVPPGTAKLQRIHGPYISETELGRVIDFLKAQCEPDYVETITEAPEPEAAEAGEDAFDPRYDEAVAFVSKTEQASISAVQRHLRIGYNRAARIIETMEREGIVGPADGAKPRQVLVKSYPDV